MMMSLILLIVIQLIVLSTSVVETYLQNKKFLKVTNLLGKETKVKNNEYFYMMMEL